MQTLMDRLSPILARWPWVALTASALMLAIAHAFETFGGYAPCTLCLRQREIYWAAAALALIAIVAGRLERQPIRPWMFNAALAAIFALSIGIAAYHAGAEWKWWPGPSTCASTGAGVSGDALAGLLNGARIRPPACDEAAWRMFGLSMAGWNVLISLKLTALSLLALVTSRSHP